MNKIVDIKSVIPDENQPRKYFDAEKMHSLKESIKKHGIQVPLIVEDMGSGKFLLIDGERRFRAATELKIKEVPVVVEKPSTEVERLVKQFNIQEQHEAWTPLEKAQALIKLSAEMGLSLGQTCKLLGVPTPVASRYIAFSQLANKEAYLRSEIPLDYALHMENVKRALRVAYNNNGQDFGRTEEKKLEAKIILNIKDGTILRRHDITKLKDALTKSPKLAEEYMNKADVTPAQMFFKGGGQGAYHLRNAVVNATYAAGHIRKFLAKRDVKMSSEQVSAFKAAKKQLEEVLAIAE